MSRRRDDSDHDGGDDRSDEPDEQEEVWEDADEDDSDGEPTVPCPYCGRDIIEDSPWCPSCDRYVTEEDFRREARPLWVVATALVCLAIALWWAFASL